MQTDYIEALKQAVQRLGNLDRFVASIPATAGRPYSKGTWSRILRGVQEPAYEHLRQIALACGLPLPEPPPEALVRHVQEWRTVGDGPPRYGVLLAVPARVSVALNDDGFAVNVISRKRRRVRLPENGPVPPELLGRGKSGNPDAIRRAVAEAAAIWRVEVGRWHK